MPAERDLGARREVAHPRGLIVARGDECRLGIGEFGRDLLHARLVEGCGIQDESRRVPAAGLRGEGKQEQDAGALGHVSILIDTGSSRWRVFAAPAACTMRWRNVWITRSSSLGVSRTAAALVMAAQLNYVSARLVDLPTPSLQEIYHFSKLLGQGFDRLQLVGTLRQLEGGIGILLHRYQAASTTSQNFTFCPHA